MMHFSSLSRRKFCQVTAAVAGAVLAPNFGFSQPVATEAKPPETGLRKPLEFVPGSYTVAFLPDTQKYCRENWSKHFFKQTSWLAENADRHQIKYVVGLGDITDDNSHQQWKIAKKAISQLDGKLPYLLATGNHDYGLHGRSDSRETLFNDYFPVAEQKAWPTFGGVMEAGKGDNAYHTFKAGNHDYLILSLEWAPRDAAVEWANQIVAKHPEHRAMLITHAYLYFDNTRYDWQQKKTQQAASPYYYGVAKLPGGVNDGEQLWNKLVSKHANFMLTHNGHIGGDGTGRLNSPGAKGNPVHQIVANYQSGPEGGEGYLRLVEFLPDDKTIQVKTYSPSKDHYKTDDENQFTISLASSAAKATS